MLILRKPCNCEICVAMRTIDRRFESQILRIGRKYKVPNRQMLRPRVGLWDEEKGELVYVRLPYGMD